MLQFGRPEIFRLRHSIVALTEELKLRKRCDAENEAKIQDLLNQNHVLQRSRDSEQQKAKLNEEALERAMRELKQQYEDKFRRFDVEQQQQSTKSECKGQIEDKMKDEMRQLQITIFHQEKTIKELEAKVKSQETSTEKALAQWMSVESNVSSLNEIHQTTKESVDRLERDVKKATSMNQTLTYQIQHHKCQMMDKCSTINNLQEQLLKVKVELASRPVEIAQIQEMEKTILLLKAKITELEDQKTELDEKFLQDAEKSKQSTADIQNAHKLIAKHLENANRNREEADKYSKECESLKARCDNLNRDLNHNKEELKRKCEEYRTAAEKWTTKETKFHTEINETCTQLEEAHVARSQLKEINRDLTERNSELNHSLLEAQAKLNISKTDSGIQSGCSAFSYKDKNLQFFTDVTTSSTQLSSPDMYHEICQTDLYQTVCSSAQTEHRQTFLNSASQTPVHIMVDAGVGKDEAFDSVNRYTQTILSAIQPPGTSYKKSQEQGQSVTRKSKEAILCNISGTTSVSFPPVKSEIIDNDYCEGNSLSDASNGGDNVAMADRKGTNGSGVKVSEETVTTVESLGRYATQHDRQKTGHSVTDDTMSSGVASEDLNNQYRGKNLERYTVQHGSDNTRNSTVNGASSSDFADEDTTSRVKPKHCAGSDNDTANMMMQSLSHQYSEHKQPNRPRNAEVLHRGISDRSSDYQNQSYAVPTGYIKHEEEEEDSEITNIVNRSNNAHNFVGGPHIAPVSVSRNQSNFNSHASCKEIVEITQSIIRERESSSSDQHTSETARCAQERDTKGSKDKAGMAHMHNVKGLHTSELQTNFNTVTCKDTNGSDKIQKPEITTTGDGESKKGTENQVAGDDGIHNPSISGINISAFLRSNLPEGTSAIEDIERTGNQAGNKTSNIDRKLLLSANAAVEMTSPMPPGQGNNAGIPRRTSHSLRLPKSCSGATVSSVASTTTPRTHLNMQLPSYVTSAAVSRAAAFTTPETSMTLRMPGKATSTTPVCSNILSYVPSPILLSTPILSGNVLPKCIDSDSSFKQPQSGIHVYDFHDDLLEHGPGKLNPVSHSVQVSAGSASRNNDKTVMNTQALDQEKAHMPIQRQGNNKTGLNQAPNRSSLFTTYPLQNDTWDHSTNVVQKTKNSGTAERGARGKKSARSEHKSKKRPVLFRPSSGPGGSPYIIRGGPVLPTPDDAKPKGILKGAQSSSSKAEKLKSVSFPQKLEIYMQGLTPSSQDYVQHSISPSHQLPSSTGENGVNLNITSSLTIPTSMATTGASFTAGIDSSTVDTRTLSSKVTIVPETPNLDLKNLDLEMETTVASATDVVSTSSTAAQNLANTATNEEGSTEEDCVLPEAEEEEGIHLPVSKKRKKF